MNNNELSPVLILDEAYSPRVFSWLYLEEDNKLVLFMDRLSSQFNVQKFYIVFKGVESYSFSRVEFIEDAKKLEYLSKKHILFKRTNVTLGSSLSEYITFKAPHLSSLTITAESFQVFDEG